MTEIDKKIVAEIEKTAKALNLPEDILQTAIEFFKTLRKEGFVKSRSGVGIAMACLYYTIKLDSSCLAISLRSFAEKTPCARKEIYRIYSKLVQREGELPRVCTIRPTIFVREFGKKMGFSKRALAGATRLAEEIIKERVHLGRDPITLAATCLYAAGVKFGEGITQEEILDGCGVHQVSIRNTLKYPFFVKQKIAYEQFKIISEEALSELIPKLLKTKQEEIPFHQLRQNLRRHFQNELKGFSIPTGRLNEVILALKAQNLVKTIPWPECKEREPNCPCRSEDWPWEWPCKNYLLQV